MASKVYFSPELDEKKVDKLFEVAGFGNLFQKGELVALKLHFGERGNTAFVKPKYVKRAVDKVKVQGGRPFLTDCNTLYKGSRSDTLSHLQIAYEHGFTYEAMGAPVIIADGISGKEAATVPVNLKHFKEVKIGAAAYHADSLIAITHFKGHEVTGFGGALKNIGMGLGTRAGKQMMHADISPQVDPFKCTGCELCLQWCPTEAIALGIDKKAFIDFKKCIGCAECIAICKFEAISISWAGSPASVQEKIVEYFYGAVKNKKGKAGYFNFLMDITPICDCYDHNELPIVPDIGILASLDPIAIDQASVDLVNQTKGIKSSKLKKDIDSKDKFKVIYPSIDWSVQLAYGEKLGLGSRSYELINV